MAVIIWEGMYQPLAWQSSTVALEPCIQLLMQNHGISTFLCQKLLIKPFNPSEVPKRSNILRGRGGTGEFTWARNRFFSPEMIWIFSPEENWKSKHCVNKGSLVSKFKEWAIILQISERELSLSRKRRLFPFRSFGSWYGFWIQAVKPQQHEMQSDKTAVLAILKPVPSPQEGKHVLFKEHKI